MALSKRDEEFSAFVRQRRHEFLRSACLLTAGDAHLAEDLVQTAFTKLYLAWPRVRRQDSPAGYTWRIIVNSHLDEVRRPHWRRERPVADPPELTDPVSEAFPDVPESQAVRAALASLPAGMRAAVVLRHWADFSVAETARMLNCSEGTVKSQTAKGISRLREALGSQQEARTLLWVI
jgi:RNA polymerase sigma-70 factor (sigma-E family)